MSSKKGANAAGGAESRRKGNASRNSAPSAAAAAAAAAEDDDGAGSVGSGGSAGAEPFVRQLDAYDSWKQNLPILYDCFIHSNLEWPSYACAWGAVLPDRDANGAPLQPPAAAQAQAASGPSTPTTPAAAAAAAATPQLTGAALTPRLYPTSYVTQQLYLSRSTDSKLVGDKWLGSPNMLLKTEIYYPNQYRAQDISKMQNFDEDQRNPALLVRKKIVHPGEINRIKVVPQFPDLVATHTDSPLVFIFNTATQPSRRSQLNSDPSVPDLTLQGHVERADCNTLYYALDCSPHHPLIISGGSDQKICLWSIADYCSTLLTTAHVEAQAAVAAAAGTHASGMQSATVGSPRSAPLTPSKKHVERLLSPRMIFSGHTAQVEEVQFHPRHQQLLCSVGDDRLLMLWDMRLGGARPALRIDTTHTDDVNAVHWNSVNDNLLLTGSSDHSVKLVDLRRVAKADSFTRRYTQSPDAVRKQHAAAADQGASAVVRTFRGHTGNVTNVQWHSSGEYFASGSDDGDLCVWSIRGVEELNSGFPMDTEAAEAGRSTPPAPSSSGQLPPRSLWDGSADGQPEHLLFRHSGHRTAVVNFAWNHFVKDGWTMASLSDDSADASLVGGGRLHVWRVTDLLHKDFRQTQADFQQAAAAAGQGQPNQTTGSSPSLPAPTPSPRPASPAAASSAMADEPPPSGSSAINGDSNEPALDLPPPDELDAVAPMMMDD